MRFYHNGNFQIENNVRFYFSLDKNIHIIIWKIMFPLILLVTLCACILHWVGVI